MVKKPTYEELEHRVKKLENSILVNNELYNAITEMSSVAIYQTDANGKCIYASPTWCVQTGLSLEETLGDGWINGLHPEDKKTVFSNWKKMVQSKGKWGLEYRYAPRNGKTIWFYGTANEILDENGNIAGYIGLNVDITDRKRVEEELLLANDRLQYLLSSTTAVIYTANAHGDYGATFISNNLTQMVGYEPHEFLLDSSFWFEHIHPEDKSKVEKEVSKVFENNLSVYEYRFRCKDGQYIWVRDEMKLVRDNEGNPLEIIGYWTDITEQRKTEMALFESEEWHRNFLENLTDTVYETDSSGNVTYANKASESLTGVPFKDIIGKPFLPFFDKKSQEIAIDVYQRTLNGESPQYDLTINNGKIAHFKNKPLKSKDGKITGVFGMARDVTALKKAEETLRKTNERLEEKVKERTVEIQEKNTALKVLLDQRLEDKKKFEETIMSNIKELVTPNLNRLKNSRLSSRQQTAVNVLESNLNEIILPFANKASSSYIKLTPTEIQVANFIKTGSSSKDIADSLGLSQRTVDSHRYNIRKKMGIRGKGINLRTYLSSLT